MLKEWWSAYIAWIFFFHNLLSAEVLTTAWWSQGSWHRISIWFSPSLYPSATCISYSSGGSPLILSSLWCSGVSSFPFTVVVWVSSFVCFKCIVCFLVVFGGLSCAAWLCTNKQKASFALKTKWLNMRLSSTEPWCKMEKRDLSVLVACWRRSIGNDFVFLCHR